MEFANGRIAKSLDIITFQVEVLDKSEQIPFCVFEELGDKSCDVIRGCNFLFAEKLLVDAGSKWLLRSVACDTTKLNSIQHLSESPKQINLQPKRLLQ